MNAPALSLNVAPTIIRVEKRGRYFFRGLSHNDITALELQVHMGCTIMRDAIPNASLSGRLGILQSPAWTSAQIIKTAATWVWSSAKWAKDHVLETTDRVGSTDPPREQQQKSLERMLRSWWRRRRKERDGEIHPEWMNKRNHGRGERGMDGWNQKIVDESRPVMEECHPWHAAHTASQAASSVAQVGPRVLLLHRKGMFSWRESFYSTIANPIVRHLLDFSLGFIAVLPCSMVAGPMRYCC